MITAIVPARAGSKRLPDKNIKLLLGRPLIYYTLDALIDQPHITKIVFTSDSPTYQKLVVDEYGDKVTIENRPPDFAGDKVKIFDEIKRLKDEGVINTKWFMLCLPTAPLRSREVIKSIIDSWSVDGMPIFSACRYSFATQFAFSINEKQEWVPVSPASPMITGNTRSQDLELHYRPNGAVYLQLTKSLDQNETFYIGAKPFVMSDVDSIDVDTELDFVIAASILKQKRIKNEK
jgi:CMP-N-acetylneuraminic acid synthetase